MIPLMRPTHNDDTMINVLGNPELVGDPGSIQTQFPGGQVAQTPQPTLHSLPASVSACKPCPLVQIVTEPAHKGAAPARNDVPPPNQAGTVAQKSAESARWDAASPEPEEASATRRPTGTSTITHQVGNPAQKSAGTAHQPGTLAQKSAEPARKDAALPKPTGISTTIRQSRTLPQKPAKAARKLVALPGPVEATITHKAPGFPGPKVTATPSGVPSIPDLEDALTAADPDVPTVPEDIFEVVAPEFGVPVGVFPNSRDENNPWGKKKKAAVAKVVAKKSDGNQESSKANHHPGGAGNEEEPAAAAACSRDGRGPRG